MLPIRKGLFELPSQECPMQYNAVQCRLCIVNYCKHSTSQTRNDIIDDSGCPSCGCVDHASRGFAQHPDFFGLLSRDEFSKQRSEDINQPKVDESIESLYIYIYIIYIYILLVF